MIGLQSEIETQDQKETITVWSYKHQLNVLLPFVHEKEEVDCVTEKVCTILKNKHDAEEE